VSGVHRSTQSYVGVTMNDNTGPNDPQQQAAEQPLTPDATMPAWEQLEAGRFMPRRIRGSCRGLALG
jgi:hypothetical protein